MRQWYALVALLALQGSWHSTARADPAPQAPLGAGSAPYRVSPKRPVPDYDGRGPSPARPGEVGLWVPRVVLSPLYLVSEYVLRQPLGVAIPAAEHADLPRKVYDFFTFGPEHKAGIVPVGLVEFNFNPSVGAYAFWDDAGFKGDDLRAHAEVWPSDWLYGSLTQRVSLAGRSTAQLRLTGLLAPRQGLLRINGPAVAGVGPDAVPRIRRLDAGASYEWRYWRSSRIQTGIGVRDVSTGDGHFAGDLDVTQGSGGG